MLSVVILSVSMPRVIMSVSIRRVIMLHPYAECHYTECLYIACRFGDCHCTIATATAAPFWQQT
jgi:hypothetical protein